MPLDPSKIKTRMEQLKVSDAEVARRAGMAPPNWHRIKSGERPDPNLSTAERIADALKISLTKLLV